MEEKHGDDYEKDYFTDVVKRQAIAFIESVTQSHAEAPFFMYVSPPAPHRPATPAPQYEHAFDGQVAPRTVSYNFEGKGKHWIISEGKDLISSRKFKV